MSREVISNDVDGPQSGEILAKTARRHTSPEFVSFLTEIVASQPTGRRWIDSIRFCLFPQVGRSPMASNTFGTELFRFMQRWRTPERRELQRRVHSRSIRADDSRRARVILELAAGRGVRETAADSRCSTSYVQRWIKRFRAARIGGLVAQHKGRTVAKGAAKLEARILEWTRRGPDDGSTQWSSRRLAQRLGTTHMAVARVWKRYGLQPHRLRHHMVSDDPNFESKAADIIGLYLRPPAHAAFFCVDEKSAIQE